MAYEARRLVLTALAVNAVLAAAKLAASIHSGSSALLAEAVHSLADAASQASLLYGLAASPPTRERGGAPPGLALHFWAYAAAALYLAMAAGVAILAGVDKLAAPAVMADADAAALVLGAALVLEVWLLHRAIRHLAPSADAGMLARIGEALGGRGDVVAAGLAIRGLAALAGLLAALAGVLGAHRGGLPSADAAAAIAIGLVLAAAAALLALGIKRVLTGAATGGVPVVGGVVAAPAGSPPATIASPAEAVPAPRPATPTPAKGNYPPPKGRRKKGRH